MSAPSPLDRHALERLVRAVGERGTEEVLELYLASAGERMAAVHAGVAGADLSGAARALHDLKSSAALLGAVELERVARELEQHARAAETGPLAARLGELDEAAARADAELRRALDRRRG